MSLYARLARLRVEIERYELVPLELDVSAHWTRKTTTIRLLGGQQEGLGEDIGYRNEDQEAQQERGPVLPLAGEYTLDGFSRRLDGLELFPHPPEERGAALYRRWAYESAALDLALRQAGLSLAEALDLEVRPVNYVVSLGLGDPPSLDPIRRRLELYPDLRFKLDPNRNWGPELIEELRAAGVVDTLDLKGQYFGTFEGTAPDAELYRRVAEGFPRAWIEDPRLTAETRPVLAEHTERLSWDAPIHALSDLVTLESPPGAVNIKPSRIGFLSELFRIYEYCRARRLPMYGGGQFELGAGRGQIQHLAGLFHPNAANDVAPSAFNGADLPQGIPPSPLAPPGPEQTGFRR